MSRTTFGNETAHSAGKCDIQTLQIFYPFLRSKLILIRYNIVKCFILNFGEVSMKKKGTIISAIVILLILAISVLFLYPRSLSAVGFETKSISIVVVEDNLEHDTTIHVYNENDSEFDTIMEILNCYSYHMSLYTVFSCFEDGASLGGNTAGYWLNIYLYTELDCYGECYGILSGGTGAIVVDDAVYRIGYFGNKTALKMMDEVRRIVTPEE